MANAQRHQTPSALTRMITAPLTPAQRVMVMGAKVCLLTSFCFWLLILGQVIQPVPAWPVAPAALPTMAIEVLLTITLALSSTLVTPIFWSALFPNTMAAQLLQELRRTTWGFYVIAGSLVLLVVFAFAVAFAFLYQRPVALMDGRTVLLGEADLPFVVLLTLIMLIFFVAVPAWTWNQLTPLDWALEGKQSFLVRRLRVQHDADIAIMKTTLLRMQQQAAVGIANLMPAERAELVAAQHALFRGMDDTLRAIAGAFHDATGAEIVFPEFEDAVAEHFATVARELEAIAGQIRLPASRVSSQPNAMERQRPDDARVYEARVLRNGTGAVVPVGEAGYYVNKEATESVQGVTSGHDSSAVQHGVPAHSVPGSAAARQQAGTRRNALARAGTRRNAPGVPGSLPYREHYLAARDHLGRTFTTTDVMTVCKVASSTARKMRIAWMDAGVVDRTDLKDVYCWTDQR